QMIEKALGARSGERVDRDQAVAAEDEPLRALGPQERFRQQLVADLLLQPPPLAPARLLLRARTVFLAAGLERILDRRRRQQPRLQAQLQEVRARDTAGEPRRCIAGRRLPPRA